MHNSPDAMRIIESGGEVCGPHRVLPGRLSVSRALGDAHAKITKFGGNPNVLTATPDIKHFTIQENHDFIAITSDGIFDKMTNSEVISDIWNCGIVESKLNDLDPHILAGVIA